MKQILLSFTLLSVLLLSSCSDQIQAPASSTPERIVYTTVNNSIKGYIPSVYSVNTDGTGSIQIAGEGVLIAVSPTKILWNESNNLTMPNFKIANSDGSNARMIDLALASNERISDKGGPALSPDGTKLSFSTIHTGDSLFRLFVMNVDGTNKKEVTNIFNHGIGPAFSPDGSQIVYYTANHGGLTTNCTMEVANIDGSNKMKLADISSSDLGGDGSLSILWSSKNRIAYFDHFKIYITGPDKSNQHQAGFGIPTGWSADGNKLTYSSDPANLSDPTFFDVYYTEDEGITPFNVTHSTDYNEIFGEWSADGKSMIVTRWQGEFNKVATEIVKIDLSTNAVTPIATTAGFGYFVKQ